MDTATEMRKRVVRGRLKRLVLAFLLVLPATFVTVSNGIMTPISEWPAGHGAILAISLLLAIVVGWQPFVESMSEAMR